MNSLFAPTARAVTGRWRSVALAGVPAVGCATGAPATADPGGSTVISVAAENFLGQSCQAARRRAREDPSLINSPDADPHDYEATAADGRSIATARVAIVNKRRL